MEKQQMSKEPSKSTIQTYQQGTNPQGVQQYERRKQTGAHDVHRQRTEIKPQLVQIVERLLEKQGIEYYEKNVTNQLLEFMHYYSSELLQEASIYSKYAGKGNIDVNDLHLAMSSQSFNSFTRPLPISEMQQNASIKNSQPLPKIEEQNPIQGGTVRLTSLLPSNEHCQINPNIQVYSEEIQKDIQEKQMKKLGKQQKQTQESISQKEAQLKQRQEERIQQSMLGKRPQPEVKQSDQQIEISFTTTNATQNDTMMQNQNAMLDDTITQNQKQEPVNNQSMLNFDEAEDYDAEDKEDPNEALFNS